jgi:hypothetical protein
MTGTFCVSLEKGLPQPAFENEFAGSRFRKPKVSNEMSAAFCNAGTLHDSETETSSPLRCSICFLTFTGKACSARRNS